MDSYFSFQVCSLAKEKIPRNQRSHFVKRESKVFFQFCNFVVWGRSLVEAFWKDDAKEAACWKTTRSPSSVLFVFRSCGCDFFSLLWLWFPLPFQSNYQVAPLRRAQWAQWGPAMKKSRFLSNFTKVGADGDSQWQKFYNFPPFPPKD